MCTQRITGIIWVGPVYDRGGYGSVSRNYILGLRRRGIPVRVVNFGHTHDDLHPETVHILRVMEKTDVGRYPIGVVNYTPDIFPKIKFRNVVKTVGCTIFETDRIPEKWVPHLNAMDEVWVPTKFNYDTFSQSGVDSKKIRIIPYAVDTDYYRPISDTMSIPGKKGFVFLYVFAFGWRKGFDLLLEAYCKEFTASDDVTLVLKVYGWGNEKEDIKKMILDSVRARVDLNDAILPHFIIMDAALNQDEMRLLYNTCDLYISAERASGWGMPCMEAMAMGKPAAAVNWSGSTEFMHAENSLLIQPEKQMVPVDPRLSQQLPELYGGHKWPEVKVAEISRIMRYAYDHSDKIKAIAQRGEKDVRSNYSLNKVAEQIENALCDEKINERPWYSVLLLPGVHIKGTFRRKRRALERRLKKNWHSLKARYAERQKKCL